MCFQKKHEEFAQAGQGLPFWRTIRFSKVIWIWLAKTAFLAVWVSLMPKEIADWQTFGLDGG